MPTRNDWLETYVEGFMFHDIQACIDGRANFAGPLVLSVYTEFLGGLFRGNLDRGAERANYVAFLTEMGYSLAQAGDYYTKVRSGLVHQYFIKQDNMVAISSPERRGIFEQAPRTYFFCENYFDELKKAYFRYKANLATSATLQENFDRALGNENLPPPVRLDYSPQTTSMSGDVVQFVYVTDQGLATDSVETIQPHQVNMEETDNA